MCAEADHRKQNNFWENEITVCWTSSRAIAHDFQVIRLYWCSWRSRHTIYVLIVPMRCVTRCENVWCVKMRKERIEKYFRGFDCVFANSSKFSVVNSQGQRVISFLIKEVAVWEGKCWRITSKTRIRGFRNVCFERETALDSWKVCSIENESIDRYLQ